MVYDPNLIKAQESQFESSIFYIIEVATFTCEDCPNECLTCFNEYECLTCKSNYKLAITTCILDCLINQYYDGTNCLNCHYSCKQCQSNTACIICESQSLRYLENGQCKCFDGYYDYNHFLELIQNNIQKCQSCDKLCSKCSGSSNKNCQECIVLNNLILNGNTCECQAGYYFDEFDIRCKRCSNKCETCFDNSNSQCLSCYSTQFRVIDGFNCVCQSGYYDINQDICIQCPSLEDVSLTFCYKVCGNGSTIWFNQNCPNVICPSGYNNVNNQCKPICGDSQIVTGEQCDDGNLIQFDGCYNCRFQCPPQCISNPTFILIILLIYAVMALQVDWKNVMILIAFNLMGVINVNMNANLNVHVVQNLDYDKIIQIIFSTNMFSLYQLINKNLCLNIRGICQECLTFGWAFDPFTKMCIESCGDKFIVGNEQCEDMNNIMLDGCYNCKLSCQESCLTCTINGCMLCKAGYQLVNRYCRNICGDSIIVDGEDCDDGNLFPFDACQQCVYQCQIECLNCIRGNCIFCIDGFEAVEGKCVSIYHNSIIHINEQNKQYTLEIIEFCKVFLFGICYQCHNGYLLNNFQNICELDKGKEIIKFTVLDHVPQFIEYCQIQINNECITCFNNYQLDLLTNNCEPICGDGILSGIEECEDFNDKVLDGCYQCKYQCNQNCEFCEFGKCILCQIDSVFVPKTFQCENIQFCNEPGSYYSRIDMIQLIFSNI